MMYIKVNKKQKIIKILTECIKIRKLKMSKTRIKIFKAECVLF